MTEPKATGYDLLSARPVAEHELRTFLLDCLEIPGHELFVCQDDRVAEETRVLPREMRFSAFCTYRRVSGHFVMAFDIGIEGNVADRVGRREFARRFAACFDTYVLYGDNEPPGLWTVLSADGTRLRAAMNEEPGRYELYAATARIPGLPEVPVDESLWQLR